MLKTSSVHMLHLPPGIRCDDPIRRPPDTSQPDPRPPLGKLNSPTTRAMSRRVTTRTRSRKTGAPSPKPRQTTTRSRPRKPKPVEAAPASEEILEPPAEVLQPEPEGPVEAVIVTSLPEPGFVAHVPPPEPPVARPTRRRGIFFDVENTSRAVDISRVVEHLQLDWAGWTTAFTAVGNWRVIGHDTARLLAQHGASLVHSAPSVGVRDWSDLRIAVSAGVWLAGARPGDIVEIVSDDQAFDAVGDVAASLGVTFRRTSYRALAGGRAPADTMSSAEGRSRRSRHGGRRGRGGRDDRRAPEPLRVAPSQPAAEAEPHTAPHDEIVGVVQELLATSPSGVSLDALANALRERGFSRPPGSPRLITRLRRIKELQVSRAGTIRLVEGQSQPVAPELPAPAHGWAPASSAVAVTAGVADEAGQMLADVDEPGAAPSEGGGAAGNAARRRRRRGGRRRRGRRGGGGATVAAAPDGA